LSDGLSSSACDGRSLAFAEPSEAICVATSCVVQVMFRQIAIRIAWLPLLVLLALALAGCSNGY
jgi:hypothetical protein